MKTIQIQCKTGVFDWWLNLALVHLRLFCLWTVFYLYFFNVVSGSSFNVTELRRDWFFNYWLMMSFSQAWSLLLLVMLFRFVLKLAEICILCWYSQGFENNCQISASIKCRLQIYSSHLFLAAAFWVLAYVLLACKDCTSYFHRNLIVWGRETL